MSYQPNLVVPGQTDRCT